MRHCRVPMFLWRIRPGVLIRDAQKVFPFRHALVLRAVCPQGTHCLRKRRWQVFDGPSVHRIPDSGRIAFDGRIRWRGTSPQMVGPGAFAQASVQPVKVRLFLHLLRLERHLFTLKRYRKSLRIAPGVTAACSVLRAACRFTDSHRPAHRQGLFPACMESLPD